MFAIRARPWRPTVVIPACAPVSEIAGTPRAWSAMDTSVALWCSPVARSTSSSRRVGIVGDRTGQGEQLVRRVAHRRDDDHELRPVGALPCDPARDATDPIGVGEGRPAEFLHDERGGHGGHSSAGVLALPPSRPGAATRTIWPQRRPSDVFRT